MRLMLDATFLIDHLKGDVGAIRTWDSIFRDGHEPIVNEVVVCELQSGLRSHDRPFLEALLEPVEFVQPGRAAALDAGRWRWEARDRGMTLSLADSLIAAAAAAVNGAVLTRNLRDFALTPVPVETY